MKHYRLILFICCIAAMPAKAVVSLSGNDQAALMTNIELHGSTSIIIEYSALSGQSNGLAAAQGEARSSIIRSIHQGFVDSLSDSTAQTVSDSFLYVPGSVMSVNKEQLQEVRNNPFVKHIYQNHENHISLQESVDIVLPGSAKDRFSGKGQSVAVLDSGVDRTHSFFTSGGVNRVVSEACYSGGGQIGPNGTVSLCPNGAATQIGTGASRDCTFPNCDHGTHVAGIAAGNTGVANEAGIVGIQVFTGIRGNPDRITAFDSDIIKGLERVFTLRNTHNIAAANMSLGGGRHTGSCNAQNTLMTSIIGQLKTAGVATIIASGNDGFSDAIGYPACISAAVAVGSTSDFTGTSQGRSWVKDQRTYYSNHSASVDLFAPGSLIRSSVPGNGFGDKDGTSMAAPHVAGAFAVIKAQNTALTVDQIENAFKSVGPNVTHAGVSRRRIAILEALSLLGLVDARPSSLVIAPVLALLLDDSQPSPPPVCTLPVIVLGQTRNGVWSTSSPFSNNRSGSRSAPIMFQLTSATTVFIDLAAPTGIDTYLYLMQGCNASGPVITEDDDGGEGTNSRIAWTLPAGVYTIDPTTFSPNVTSGFALRLLN